MEQPTTCERQCKIITPEAGHTVNPFLAPFFIWLPHIQQLGIKLLSSLIRSLSGLYISFIFCCTVFWSLIISDEALSQHQWLCTVTVMVPVETISTSMRDETFMFYRTRDSFWELLKPRGWNQDWWVWPGGRTASPVIDLSWSSRCTCVQQSHHRACDVGGKSTHLVSRVPDTHCACSDPPITLVLTQRAEADQALHMGWVAGNNTEKWATTRENHEHEDLVPKRKAASVIWNYFSYKQDDIDRTRVLCRQWRHLLLQTEVTFRSVPHSSVRQQVTSQQQRSITGAVQLIWWKFLYFFILQYISQGYKKSQCQFFPISCSSNHVEDASIWPVESVSLKLLWLICFFLLVC